jgi:hypothetical protein
MAFYGLKFGSHAEKQKIFQKIMKEKTHLYLKIMFLGEELLVLRPTPNLDKHPLSAVRYCLFKFAATNPYMAAVFSVLNKRRFHVMVSVLKYTNMRFRSSGMLRGLDG